MSYISLVEYDQSPDEIKHEFDDQISKHGKITNMKRTLLHSLPAFKAYMEWYTLKDEIEPFIGKRGVIIFSHAISTQNDCLICSTFFRKILIDQGEKPEDLVLSEQEQVLAEFGKQVVKNPDQIPQEIYLRLKDLFSEKEIVLLTAFAGLMMATNLINTVLKVPLDDYLDAYKK
ncbi:carboxymuconolactone decarboxylase family protein [Candidatus Formimonas warabiya]|uniref:Carboxymuconolactone decarboxylase family protein n=1 Tax=Formimonas warabiya TaxID=1761012 RepID=A0A3G1KZP7_FORW1|nr:carboxymuconolactone decarboxylase family protein [Candidatus Formimonas warabiya]ATW28013.1 hypothetical protein DCMF_27580 [Candidatus Formimonas warabiya]